MAYIEYPVTPKDWIARREMETNIAQALLRHMERGKRVYYLSTRGLLANLISGKLASIGGADSDHILWLHFDAANWLRSEDCANYQSVLWWNALCRLHLKLETGDFATREDNLREAE